MQVLRRHFGEKIIQAKAFRRRAHGQDGVADLERDDIALLDVDLPGTGRGDAQGEAVAPFLNRGGRAFTWRLRG